MHTFKFIAFILLLAVLNSCGHSSINVKEAVNPIIGDISFVHSFDSKPDPQTNEFLRVQTHLRYVEAELRQKEVSHLSAAQQEQRASLLDLLHAYWTAGIFPKNHDYPDQRIPCFIDQDERICAVGYLIEQTAGREIAEEINAKFKYEYVMAMHDPAVDDWIKTSCLTREECAMIQPAYGPLNTENYITPGYGTSSALLSGINVSMNVINGIQLLNGDDNKAMPIMGMVTGIGQIALGTFNFPEERVVISGQNSINESQRNLSWLNIGLGTSTVVLSGWSLIRPKKHQDKPTSWNIQSLPVYGSNMGVGVGMAKRF